MLSYARLDVAPNWILSTYPWTLIHWGSEVEVQPSSFTSPFKHSQVFLPLPTQISPALSTFLQADTQSSPLLGSRCSNNLNLPCLGLTTTATLWTPKRLYKTSLTFLSTPHISTSPPYVLFSPSYDSTWDTPYTWSSGYQLSSCKHHMDVLQNPHSEQCSPDICIWSLSLITEFTLRPFINFIPFFHFLNFSINNSQFLQSEQDYLHKAIP